jgi:hypothetical protein
MANIYDAGDDVRVSGAFANAAGTAIDPDAVFAQYKDPSGNVTSLEYGEDAELVRDATGSYHVDIDADEAGQWFYRFYSTGSGKAAAWKWFHVRSGPLD